MPRGPRKEITYTGKAAKIHEKVLKLEAELKSAKEDLKNAYKEQLKEEKLAAKKASKAKQVELMKMIKESGKTPEEIIELLNGHLA